MPYTKSGKWRIFNRPLTPETKLNSALLSKFTFTLQIVLRLLQCGLETTWAELLHRLGVSRDVKATEERFPNCPTCVCLGHDRTTGLAFSKRSVLPCSRFYTVYVLRKQCYKQVKRTRRTRIQALRGMLLRGLLNKYQWAKESTLRNQERTHWFSFKCVIIQSP